MLYSGAKAILSDLADLKTDCSGARTSYPSLGTLACKEFVRAHSFFPAPEISREPQNARPPTPLDPAEIRRRDARERGGVRPGGIPRSRYSESMPSTQRRSPRPSVTLPPLLPEPRRIQLRGGTSRIPSALRIASEKKRAADILPTLPITIERLRSGIQQACGVELHLAADGPTRSSGTLIELGIDASLKTPFRGHPHPLARRDAYRLSSGHSGIRIWAGGESGLRYGVETLLQLITAAGRIPHCRIDDGPDLPLRGIMLDISRGKVPTPASIEALIDDCATFKLNFLMLYTEHTFRFLKHPEIGRHDSPLDAEMLRGLNLYAKQRCVDLIPCLQSLGHMEHVLKLPRYRELAESESGWTIAPTDPATYSLLSDLYDEYLPLFDSKYFNANCDEPWDLGRGRSQARAAELGPGGLYLEHVGRLQKLARLHGKRMMIWGDVVHAHADRIPEIDRNLILLDWWYEAGFEYDRVAHFARNGIEFMVCPGTSSWNSLFPRIENSLLNISRWAKAGRRHGALGLLNTDWGDHGHYNLQGNSLFAYAWGAQESWSGGKSRNFDRAFSRVVFGNPRGPQAGLYRALGAIHDPGFSVFNGSPLQFLFFDSVESAYFVSKCRPGRLRVLARRLSALRPRILRAREGTARNLLALDEMLYALDASLFAVRKAEAGLEYLAWRRDPGGIAARARRRLGRRLIELADEQTRLGRRLRKLWLARARPSNLDITLGRLRRSSRHLRSAARRLDTHRPSPAPTRTEISIQGVRQALLETLQ